MTSNINVKGDDMERNDQTSTIFKAMWSEVVTKSFAPDDWE